MHVVGVGPIYILPAIYKNEILLNIERKNIKKIEKKKVLEKIY